MVKHSRSFLLLLVLLFTATIFIAVINADLHNPDSLKRTIEGLGQESPIVFVLVCAFRSFLLLPCGVFSAAGGVLYGPVKGTLLTLIGFTFNALILYFMANYLGRDWVKRILEDKFKYVDTYVSKNSFSSFLLLRIIPLLPFDAVSCIAGISKAKVGYYVAATFIGSIPGVFIYTYFGDSLKALDYKKLITPGIIILFLTFIPIVYKLFKHRHTLKKIINKDNKTTI